MKKIEDMNYKELCELSEKIQKFFKYSSIDITKLKIVEGHLCMFTIDGNLLVWGERTGIKYYDIFGDFSMKSTFLIIIHILELNLRNAVFQRLQW